MRLDKHMRRLGAIALLVAIIIGIALPHAVCARAAEQKVVRVGWYESTYCYRDQYGERRGIAYEYQRKIAAHTGWTYEYVEESWPNLLQMLIDGEIDLLSDVSYKEERAGLMLYPALAMGSESYYVYIDADNTDVNSEDLQTLSGKRVGVNRDSFQEGLLRKWSEKNSVAIDIVELTDDESFSMEMLAQGDIDALVSMDSFGAQERVIPVTKIGASDYFFAVNKNRPDLLSELNSAMSAIQDEDPYINQRMFDEYVHVTRSNAFLAPSQESWLKDHGTIRIGYWEDYLPFCATDAQTGELTGALKDYLAYASNCLKNAEIRFDAVPYPSTDAAFRAMKRGEIDCVFPINLSTYQGETMGILTINPIMKTDMSVLMRSEERPEIVQGKVLTVAIEAGNANYETLIRDEIPYWTIVNYPSLEDCFRAVVSKEADGVLACNYRMGVYEPLRVKHRLVALPTGEAMELSIAVGADSPELYSILNKIANLSQSEDMEYALVRYMYSGQKVSVMAFLADHWIGVLVVLTAVFAVIVVLLYQKLKAERRASEQQRLLEEAAEIGELKQTITSLLDNMPGMNFTKDAKTGVYLACNQAFARYARRKDPSEVIGLTPGELFDAKTAERFAEDDRMALSMDRPYIFFEDIPDDAGNSRQVRTTKLKYTDDAGRLCVLGMLQDVTENVRIRRDSAMTKEAYEKAWSAGVIYTHIAQALARGYTDLYYINLDSEEYIEYRIDEDSGTLVEVRRGWHFFEECQIEAEQLVFPEDQDAVIRALDRRALVAALEKSDTFNMTYRLNGEGGPTYVSMKVTRMKDDDRYIILGVTDVDEQMKQRNAASRMKEEKIAYTRLSALAGDYLCVYVVDPQTGRYREFSAADNYEVAFAPAKAGSDFFTATREAARQFNHPEDLNRFLSAFTVENVMWEIERNGVFTLSYRLMMEGRPRYVQLKAVVLEEKEGPRLIVGINDIDKQVRQEETYVRNLAQARIEASVDALTGVKNRHAYLMAEERLNAQIAEHRALEYAIVVLDVNDLKEVNDTAGHEAGDQYLKDACKIICDIFKHSPVFRIGGDEFAVIAQGSDYACIEELVRQVDVHNAQARRTGGIVIACGMAKHGDEPGVAPVFERADQSMYGNKNRLKAENG